MNRYNFCLHTNHYYGFFPMINRVIIDHADDGHAKVTADAEGNAESQSRQDCDDITARHPKTRAVHDGKFLLLHQLRTTLCRQLDGLAILLPFLEDSWGTLNARVNQIFTTNFLNLQLH